jgi:lipopolysaccharide export LptBFGC system permease protein LptF
LISKHSTQIFSRLFTRTALLFTVLSLLGGLGSLASTLSRSPFLLDFSTICWVFLGGFPKLAVQFLPVSALGALLWWGSGFTKSRAWLGLQTVGQGGRSLLVSVGGFALCIALSTWLVSVAFVGPGGELKAKAMWEGAGPRAGQALQIRDLMLLPRSVEDGVLHEVSFAWGEQPVFGQAAEVRLQKDKQFVSLRDGVFRHEDMGALFSFSELQIPLEAMGVYSVYSGPKGQAESLKEWAWPLMVVSLLLLSLPLILRERRSQVFGFWVGAWVLIRVCDHQVYQWGPLFCALLPVVLSGLISIWIWRHWEDA